MANTVIMTLICIFAVYGIASFVMNLGAKFMRRGKLAPEKIYTAVFFHNKAEAAEGCIRSMVLERVFSGCLEGEDIIAIDTGSCDDTMLILKKLQREYDNVYAMTYDEYINFVKEY